MNIWLKTQTIKHNKLRESLANSSVASMRTPLPVIVQNQRNDEVLSNSNISIRLGTQSQHSQDGYGYQFDQDTNHQEPVRNNYAKSIQVRNDRGTLNLERNGKSNPLFENYQSEENTKTNQPPMRNNMKPTLNNLYCSSVQSVYRSSSQESSKNIKSSTSSKGFSKYKLNKNKNYNPFVELNIQKNQDKNKDENSKRRKMYKLPISEDKSVKFVNNKKTEQTNTTERIEMKMQRFFQKSSSQDESSGLDRYRSQQNLSNQSNSDSNEPINFPKGLKRVDSYRNYQADDQERQVKNPVRKYMAEQKIQNKVNKIERKNGLPETHQKLPMYNLQTERNLFRDEIDKEKTLFSTNSEKQQQNKSNRFSSRWRNSLNSFASVNLPNSSERALASNNSNSNKNNLPQSTHRRVETSRNNTFHTNSKRLLTTGRQNDRREYIIGIIEYCSNEVGMACYNINTGEIKLTQIIERMTYIKTISTLQRFYPQEIIFSATLEDTLLMRKLMNIFRRTSFKPVKRNLFDQTKGYYIYTLRGNKNQHNPDHKFLSYAALHALLTTMQNTFEFTLTYSALNIKWHYLQQVLVIDSQTITDLQIFINKQTKIIKNTFIDNFKCLTDGGMRMLRANILQPLTDQAVINERFNLVQILLKSQNKGILDMLAKQLCKFKNYQPITAKFIQNPKCDNIRSVKSYLNGILLLSRMCFQLQNLQKKVASIINNGLFDPVVGNNQELNRKAKQNSDRSIIKTLHAKLKDNRVEQIRKVIQQNFDPEILKNYESSGVNNEFDFKNNKKKQKNTQTVRNNNGKRDNFIFLFKLQKISDQFAQISRLTYSHTIQDILRIFEQIKQKCPVDNSLKLLYNEYRGYFISAKSTQARPIDLAHISMLIQDDIIYINTKANTVTFSTSMLISLNNRLKQNQHKLIYQSTQLLLDIIKQIQKNMEILFEINYWISMVDMVMAFVMFVKLYQTTHNITFSRPIFTKNQPNQPVMKIEKLRTIWTMEKLQKLSTDLTLSLNQGGSSLVILKELNSFDQLNILYSIGYLTILAQIGCLVPAELYCTPIYETLISKMEVQGNLQNKMSHFQTQLFSLKNILENAQEREQNHEKAKSLKKTKCLILIDEICKGTKPVEQYALSMAAIEELTNTNKQRMRNISVVLVSDWTLFNILGKFDKVSLCEFSGVEEQDQKDQNKCLKNKQSQLLNCLKNYNFSANFQSLYRNLPKIRQE